MSYQAAFACHLIAVVLFVAALLLTAASLPGLARRRASGEAARLRALNLWVASPALLAVWGFGATMAVEAGWLAFGWLRAKLVLVVLLSALHGRQMRVLRRIAAGERPRVGSAPFVIVAAAVAAIALLAATKPF